MKQAGLAQHLLATYYIYAFAGLVRALPFEVVCGSGSGAVASIYHHTVDARAYLVDFPERAPRLSGTVGFEGGGRHIKGGRRGGDSVSISRLTSK